MPPIADSVMAIHLVVDSGQHFWIEPKSFVFGIEAQLTDDKKLRAFYGNDEFGGPLNFNVIRNDDLFHSVLVSAGRFGVVYSIVLATVRQYTLHQERRLTTWEAVRKQLKGTKSPFFTLMSDPVQSPNKFLQIGISVTPHGDFKLHHAGVTKRRNVPMAVVPGSSVPAGRAERVGPVVDPLDPQLQNQIRIALLSDPDPEKRKAGLFIWQMITSRVFADQQKDSDYEAVSYAVMETHDYFNQSCNVNVQSIEVFFDAAKPMLLAFVEALLTFEIGQEINQGRAFVGYISLRFMGPTRALLGPQKFPVTCAVEVAGLADVVGTKELIDFAVTLALNPNFRAKLHWGQRNDSNRAQIETCLGNPAADPSSPMAKWRTALRELTKNGQLTGFSSEFTRRTGLEPF